MVSLAEYFFKTTKGFAIQKLQTQSLVIRRRSGVLFISRMAVTPKHHAAESLTYPFKNLIFAHAVFVSLLFSFGLGDTVPSEMAYVSGHLILYAALATMLLVGLTIRGIGDNTWMRIAGIYAIGFQTPLFAISDAIYYLENSPLILEIFHIVIMIYILVIRYWLICSTLETSLLRVAVAEAVGMLVSLSLFWPIFIIITLIGSYLRRAFGAW